MRRTTIILFCSVLFGLLPLSGCEKEPVADAWSGTVETIEALNGKSITVKHGGETVDVVREGSALKAGSTVATEHGDDAQLVLEDGTNLIVDGGTTVTLDRSAARTATIERGRLLLVTLDTPGTLRVVGRDMVADPYSKVVIEASDSRGSVTVLEGVLKSGAVELRPGRSALVSKGSIEPFTAWDMDERIAWLYRTDGRAGYGELSSVGGKMRLTEHHVKIDILGTFAQTEVIETFRNTSGSDGDLLYSFELHEDAVLTDLAIADGDDWRSGELVPGSNIARPKPAGAGAAAAEADGAAGKSGEKADSETSKTFFIKVDDGVASVESGVVRPNEEVTYRVRYIEKLTPTYKGFRYRFQMPRDREGDLRASQFSLRARAIGASRDSVTTYGYDVEIEPSADSVEMTFDAEAFVPAGDFVVDLMMGSGGTVVREKRKDEEFAGITIVPSFDAPEISTPIDLVVAIDRSGSRDGMLEQDVSLVERVLDRLPDTTRATVLACAESCEPVGELGGLVAIDELRSATQEMKLEYGGVTNLVEVGRVARAIFEQSGDDGRARRVVYVGDGQANVGPLLPGPRVASDLESVNARFHAVGKPDDIAWLEGLAQHSGGTASELLAGEPDRTASGVVAALVGGALTEVSVTLPEGAKSPYPNDISTFRAGEPITFVARARRTERIDSVVVRGKVNGEDFEEVIGLELTGTFRPFVSTIWAATGVAELEDRTADLSAKQVAGEYGIATVYYVFADRSKIGEVARIRRKAEASANKLPKKKLSPIGAVFVETGRLAVFPAEVEHEPYVKRMRQYRRVLEPCLGTYGWPETPDDTDMTLQMELGAGGEVEDARMAVDKLDNQMVSDCMLQQARRWSFPLAETNKPVRLTQPLSVGVRRSRSTFVRPGQASIPASERLMKFDEERTFEAGIDGDADIFLAAIFATPRPEMVTHFDERFAQGRLFERPGDEPAAGPVEYAYQSGRNGALHQVKTALESGPPDARLLRSATSLEARPAHQCAYRQALASLRRKEIETCPGTSEISWLKGSVGTDETPSEEPAAEISGATVELRATNLTDDRLMLVDLERTRYWWFEGDSVSCQPLAMALLADGEDEPETAGDDTAGVACTFKGLQPGLYGIHVTPDRPGDGSVVELTAIVGDEERTFELPRERSVYLAAIAIGEVSLEAPEIELARDTSFATRAAVFERLEPMIAFCHAGKAGLPGSLEVSARVDGEGRVAVGPMKSAEREVRPCVKRALESVRLRGAPENGADVVARFNFR